LPISPVRPVSSAHVGSAAIPPEIVGCGVPTGSVKLFHSQPEAELINYLDLCPAHNGHGATVLPDGVAESRDRPLLYFITHNKLSADTTAQRAQLSRLRRTLGRSE